MADRNDHEATEEEEEAEERSAPAARVVHAAVVEQGEDELARPTASLFWSGFAAGIAIMASLWVTGALHHYLPDAQWAEAVIALGYPAGFLIVILGRLQLFTEHTAVAVLPVVRQPTRANLLSLARLWSVIFIANMLGAAVATALAVHAHLQPSDTLQGMLAVSAKLLDRAPVDTLMQAIPAGFLIASIAWIRSAVNSGDFWIVFAVTYAISLAGFAHVVAGASEAFLLVWAGQASVGWGIGSFVLPALLGNIVGGTGLFALLAHAQVKNEIR
ncbi:MAG: formate/nitrite transporter family protein [Sphingomonas phyllosphaerae]